jgi:DNA-binding CsgD family transcriptional regulator
MPKAYRRELSPVNVSYSPMERKLFNQLAKGKRLTSTVLMQLLYKEALQQHFYARETVNATLASLQRKLAFNKEPIRLNSSQMAGPHAKTWWLDGR